MLIINTLPFAQLRNAEHVAFFNNIALAISKIGADSLGISEAKFAQFKAAVDAEQDIVLKAQGSMYTADMEAYDKERDRIFRRIHCRLQAATYASEGSSLYDLKAPLEKYILCKYGSDIISLAYQEESAHLSGFILDMQSHFTEEDLTDMAILEDLMALKVANSRFSDLYNERAVERSGATSELTKKLRSTSEELYASLRLHIEFQADSAAETPQGKKCSELIGVINEIVRDARQRLNQRLGKVSPSDEEEESEVSPIPFPKE